MKTLGLIGGTSWHSTVDYYRFINQSINDHFGNNTNPPLLVYTLNQAKIHQLQIEDQWDEIAKILVCATDNLHKAGAQAVMFCANTPHKVYDQVEAKTAIPIIHIADVTAKMIIQKNIDKVGFIGTKFSMEADFITDRIAQNSIDVLVPKNRTVIHELHRIIQKELTYGIINKESKEYVLNVFKKMISKGAKGIILGCTEFPLMIFQEDLPVPIFNTTQIHSQAAVDFILK